MGNAYYTVLYDSADDDDDDDDDNDDACPWLWRGNYRNIVLTLMDSARVYTTGVLGA